MIRSCEPPSLSISVVMTSLAYVTVAIENKPSNDSKHAKESWTTIFHITKYSKLYQQCHLSNKQYLLLFPEQVDWFCNTTKLINMPAGTPIDSISVLSLTD